MPSIITGPIKITGADGNVTFGDVLQITPKSTEKNYSGAGGGLVGDFSQSYSLISYTLTSDQDVADSAQTNVGS